MNVMIGIIDIVGDGKKPTSLLFANEKANGGGFGGRGLGRDCSLDV